MSMYVSHMKNIRIEQPDTITNTFPTFAIKFREGVNNDTTEKTAGFKKNLKVSFDAICWCNISLSAWRSDTAIII